ncbi:MAG: GNAT family N-acetyltransferase [Rhodospirillales bacterium]|nr:GNAT family N-acetyltransferase [Rhodospirillales bacterium]
MSLTNQSNKASALAESAPEAILRMDDVTKDDAQTIGKWAADPRFFYVYINNGIDDPEKARQAGEKYATLCDWGLQGRKSALSLSEFEGNALQRLRQKFMSEAYDKAVNVTYPWDAVYAKGLRDENGTLRGITILLHERETGDTEIGYMLDPDYHGKGVGSSMVMSALKWARENTELETLKAEVDPNNGASCGILRKLNMVQTDYIDVGPYKDRDGSPIASSILKCGTAEIDGAIAAHQAKGGAIYQVGDAVLEAKDRHAALTHDA